MLGLWVLIASEVGDYLLQSDWMAQEKTKKWLAAAVHALVYTLPFTLFLFFTQATWKALVVIAVTHFVIDHWRLARYVAWAKNFLSPRKTVAARRTVRLSEVSSPLYPLIYDKIRIVDNDEIWTVTEARPNLDEIDVIRYKTWWRPWKECQATGYPPETPPFMSIWLMIRADNVIHLAINALAISYL